MGNLRTLPGDSVKNTIYAYAEKQSIREAFFFGWQDINYNQMKHTLQLKDTLKLKLAYVLS